MIIRTGHQTVPADHIDVVRSSPLFKDLSDDDLRQLLDRAAVTRLPADAVVFTEGDTVDKFFMVLCGQVKVFRMTPGGNYNVLKVFGAGASFALTALFGGGNYPASCETVQPTSLLTIRSAALIDCLVSSPRIGDGLLTAVSNSRHMLLREIAELKGKSALQRVADFLIGLAGRDHGPAVVTLPFQRQVLAEKIGVSPEYLSRVFAKFAAYGVHAKTRTVTIDDVATLHDIYAGRAAKAVRRR